MTNIIDRYDGRMQSSVLSCASALAYGFSFAFGKAKSVYLHSFLVKIRT